MSAASLYTMSPRRAPTRFELLADLAGAVDAGRIEGWLADAARAIGAQRLELTHEGSPPRNRQERDWVGLPVGTEATLMVLGLPIKHRSAALEWLEACARGLSSALERERRLAIERSSRGALADACGRAGVGLLVTKASAQIETVNPAAEAMFLARDGLAWAGPRISGPRALLDGIRTAAGRERTVLSVPRASGRLPYLVAIEPAPVEPRPRLPIEPRVLLMIDDPALETRLCLDSLRRLHGLTEAEARTAADLSAGRTMDEIATGRGVALGTVRTHVKRLMAKTGTSRQTDVVRLLARPGPQLILGLGPC